MSLNASTSQTSVLGDITASVDNTEPIDISDEPEHVKKQLMGGMMPLASLCTLPTRSSPKVRRKCGTPRISLQRSILQTT